MADVFISYKREDRRVAERLSIALEQLGFDIWWDFELLSGDRYRKVIRAVIDQCSAAIVLWSTRAVESDFVIDEATHAKAQGKLCPARIDGVELPFGFGSIHTDELSDWDGELTHAGFQSLVRGLEERVGRKAKFGAGRAREAQAATAELEAFKAAQTANNASALQSFLRTHPRGAFASFVRGQLETMGATVPESASAAPASAPPRRPEDYRGPPPGSGPFAASGGAGPAGPGPSTAPRPAYPPPPPSSAPTGVSPWPFVLIGVGVLLVIGLVWAVIAANTNSTYTYEEPAATVDPYGLDPAAMPAPEVEVPGVRDVSLLHPDVRTAVLGARDMRQRAETAAARARVVAQRAQDAATRARVGEFGTTVIPYDDGDVYEGEYSGGMRNGVGLYTYGEAAGYGDTFAGDYINDVRTGLGVYTYAANANNTHQSLRYEGEYANGNQHGVGVFYWVNGDTFAGGSIEGHSNGPGVYIYADGRRYEGQYVNDVRNGYGVFWNADGTVLQAGIWANNELTTSLTP